ncbi:putative mitochondrial protein AtMg00860 [Primulina tabacum]|uniref:putative mitochondrial protein AtMg00860 n=1 Tax=Primulina tabacum TaxID=48773 RepID=UPI003F5982C9
MEFLGHVVSSSGIEVDPSKVAIVKDWIKPKNASEIHGFSGLASYYRKFIHGFSSIAVKLTSLMKKNVKFVWIVDFQKSLEKQALITMPILAMPSRQGNFVLYTDPSKLELGVVLMQHG